MGKPRKIKTRTGLKNLRIELRIKVVTEMLNQMLFIKPLRNKIA